MFLLVLSGSQFSQAKEDGEFFSYEDYAEVLKRYVDVDGMVDYKALKADRKHLDQYANAMAALEPEVYESWNDKGKISFWLNAYNGLTLIAIIDNYPIKASFWKSRIYPANSIRQISGVWDKITFEVTGKDVTLSEIEHKILRKEFGEPLIHMAMVCAAHGCPALRDEPYTQGQLDEQLDGQSRVFLGDKNKFMFELGNKEVWISPIFDWFGEDFVKHSDEKITKNEAILEFVQEYLDKENEFFKHSVNVKRVKFLKYDWTLNEQRK
jgi:hypothetical protein